MAVVFISPKKRQRVFFLAITVSLVLFLIIFTIGVLPSPPKETTVKISLNKASIEVDTSIFSQEKFTKLQPFSGMEKQFKYNALAKNRARKQGFLSAESREEAEKIINGYGWSVVNIVEITPGRDNPFISYQ